MHQFFFNSLCFLSLLFKKKKSLPWTRHENSPYIVSGNGSFIVLCLLFRSIIYLQKYFCIWYKVRLQAHFKCFSGTIYILTGFSSPAESSWCLCSAWFWVNFWNILFLQFRCLMPMSCYYGYTSFIASPKSSMESCSFEPKSMLSTVYALTLVLYSSGSGLMTKSSRWT